MGRALFGHKDAPSHVVQIGSGAASWKGAPQIVSWSPLVMVFDNFLSDEECDHILKKADPLMEPAMLIDKANQHFRSKDRTSRGAFFDRGEDELITASDNRIAHATQVPAGVCCSVIASEHHSAHAM